MIVDSVLYTIESKGSRAQAAEDLKIPDPPPKAALAALLKPEEKPPGESPAR